jgi:SAM-dependent methyltransferase
MQFTVADKVYRNFGNKDVVALVDTAAVNILDVGCGTGDNAALLRQRDPHKRIYGISGSREEGDFASRHLDGHWTADLEDGLPGQLDELRFDCIVFSHVLEHVRDPATLLARLSARLSVGGSCVIAIPNILYWRQRLDFLRGKFEYRDSGVLDATHLRFFTYRTAVPLLFSRAPNLRVEQVSVTGNVPLGLLRHKVLGDRARERIDGWGCSISPNIFGSQILVKARQSNENATV